MRFFNPEKSLFEDKEPAKLAGFEKFREPWIEQIEAGNNKIEIGYTGYRRIEHLYSQKLKEVGKIEIINEQGEQGEPGKKFDFSSLLPKNWRFCERITDTQALSVDPNLLTSHSSKEIWFPDFYFDFDSGKKTKTFSQSKNLFNLLHEIGHSFEPKETIIRKIIIKEKMKAKISKLARIKTKDFPTEPFTGKEKQDYYQYVIGPERDAWAYALRQYRELKRQGIDIFPKEVSNKEILKIVRYYLRSSLDAGIGLMEDPLEDPKTIKTKKEAVKEARRLKSGWERFRNRVVVEILNKLMRI